jgi:hypothetical protein
VALLWVDTTIKVVTAALAPWRGPAGPIGERDPLDQKQPSRNRNLPAPTARTTTQSWPASFVVEQPGGATGGDGGQHVGGDGGQYVGAGRPPAVTRASAAAHITERALAV